MVGRHNVARIDRRPAITTTTTTLTELQTLILTTASSRDDGSVFPLSDAAEPKRQTRSLQSLISRNLVEHVPVTTDEQS